jgi:HSP20 family protein
MFNTRQMMTPWLNGGRTEPYIDIRDNNKSFVIRADVPGLDPENLDIAVSENAVTISGYKDNECKDGEGFVHHECCNGSFCRTVALPEDADTENASAAFEKNILIIEVPKKAKTQQKIRNLEIAVANDKDDAKVSTSKKKAA